MIYLLMADESYEEVPAAIVLEVTGQEVLCFDEGRWVVARYERQKVVAYSSNPVVGRLMNEIAAEGGDSRLIA